MAANALHISPWAAGGWTRRDIDYLKRQRGRRLSESWESEARKTLYQGRSAAQRRVKSLWHTRPEGSNVSLHISLGVLSALYEISRVRARDVVRFKASPAFEISHPVLNKWVCKKAKCSFKAVQRALKVLDALGVIYYVPGRGTRYSQVGLPGLVGGVDSARGLRSMAAVKLDMGRVSLTEGKLRFEVGGQTFAHPTKCRRRGPGKRCGTCVGCIRHRIAQALIGEREWPGYAFWQGDLFRDAAKQTYAAAVAAANRAAQAVKDCSKTHKRLSIKLGDALTKVRTLAASEALSADRHHALPSTRTEPRTPQQGADTEPSGAGAGARVAAGSVVGLPAPERRSGDLEDEPQLVRLSIDTRPRDLESQIDVPITRDRGESENRLSGAPGQEGPQPNPRRPVRQGFGEAVADLAGRFRQMKRERVETRLREDYGGGPTPAETDDLGDGTTPSDWFRLMRNETEG